MYGHGYLLYFVDKVKIITGIPLTIVFLAGLLFILRCTYIHLRKNAFTNLHAAELLLIFGSFCVYFTAHTIFWWKGMFASLGMTRVMAGVIPVFAVGALRGLTIITGIIYKKYKPAAAIIAIIFAFIVLQVPFVIFGKVEKLDPRLITVKEACNWLKENNVSENQVFYSHPFTVICMDINPYNKSNSRDLMFVPTEIIEEVVPKGNFVVWDSQFGPNEMHTPLERLQDTADFTFIKNFAPREEIIVLGGRKFEVKIFKRK
jgi:hypothetical protein